MESTEIVESAPSPAAASSTPSTPTIPVDTNKIIVHLKAVGNAPILKQQKFKLNPNTTFQTVIDFLRRQLRLQSPGETLFVYLNNSFAPSPDEMVYNLYKCFAVDGTLIVNYCLTSAWG